MDNITENTVTENTEAVESTEVEGAKTYTQEEVLKLIQIESDKRVTQALKTQQKKHDKQLSLAKLDDEERVKAEKDARIAELEEIVAQMNTANNKSELKSVLSARGLSAEFADIISINEDLAASQANIDKLDKLFKAAVKAEVERRLSASGGTPKGSGAVVTEKMTKEDAKKLNLAQITELLEKDPELYKKLFN